MIQPMKATSDDDPVNEDKIDPVNQGKVGDTDNQDNYIKCSNCASFIVWQ